MKKHIKLRKRIDSIYYKIKETVNWDISIQIQAY